MHYFKPIGIVLILACGVMAGVAFAAFERRRCRQAEGFVALLRHIRLQIDCFSLPVGRILASCDGKILADCGVETAELPDLSALLAGTRLYVPEEMCRLLHDFGAQLGTSYRLEQLRCCDYFLERIIPICDRLRADLPKRERMVLILPMAIAAILVLMLL
ncbi:MAG: hypothetical protein IJX39_08420 [Clostridia bacterium]|nr:hypothetical protein [Clostridia bacterium]